MVAVVSLVSTSSALSSACFVWEGFCCLFKSKNFVKGHNSQNLLPLAVSGCQDA